MDRDLGRPSHALPRFASEAKVLLETARSLRRSDAVPGRPWVSSPAGGEVSSPKKIEGHVSERQGGAAPQADAAAFGRTLCLFASGVQGPFPAGG